MIRPKPPIFETFAAAFGDVADFTLRAPGLMVVIILASALVYALDALVAARFGTAGAVSALWFVFPSLAASCAIYAPLVTLLSRRVILWEEPSLVPLRLDLFGEVFVASWRLMAVAAAPLLILVLVLSEGSLFPPDGEADVAATVVAGVALLCGLASLAWAFVAYVRFFLLVTAVAVEERGAGLRSAWAASRGLTWRICALIVPVFAVPLGILLWLDGDPPSASVTRCLLLGVSETAVTTFLTALAARVYLCRSSPLA